MESMKRGFDESGKYGLILEEELYEDSSHRYMSILIEGNKGMVHRYFTRTSEAFELSCKVTYVENLMSHISDLGLWNLSDFKEEDELLLDGRLLKVTAFWPSPLRRLSVSLENPDYGLMKEFGDLIKKFDELQEMKKWNLKLRILLGKI